MSTENYYLSYYQAILDNNATKVAKLDLFNDKEQSDFSEENLHLNYKKIFKANDPEDFLEDLLKKEKYKDFNALYILEKKYIAANYYLSGYQAILDKNSTKFINLYDLSAAEIEIYPNEYPELNYDEIFLNGDPDDLLTTLIEKEEYKDFYKDLYVKFLDKENPLATAKNINIRESSHLELMKHPLIDYCPVSLNITENLLSVSYSTVIDKEELSHSLKALINQSSIINDVLLVVAISINIKPCSIVLIGDTMEVYDPTRSDSGGYYDSLKNRLVVTSKNSKLNLEFFIHELAHKMIDEIFNNKVNPYNLSLKDKYHQAIKNTLFNIQKFIQENLDLNIKFEDQNDSWKMGKALSSILLPQYLEREEDIEDFILLLQEYNLPLDKQYVWLDEDSLLGCALSYSKFELADALVIAGAKIPFIQNYLANINILNWFVYHKQKIDLDLQDCNGQTVLDYAKDNQQVIKILIENAEIYPPNFTPICIVNYECSKTKDDIIKNQLSILEDFLQIYSQKNYDQNREDCEFIVRLPQVIAGNLYEGKIIEVLQPLAQYWQDSISPAAAEYIATHSSEINLSGADYTTLFI